MSSDEDKRDPNPQEVMQFCIAHLCLKLVALADKVSEYMDYAIVCRKGEARYYNEDVLKEFMKVQGPHGTQFHQAGSKIIGPGGQVLEEGQDDDDEGEGRGN